MNISRENICLFFKWIVYALLTLNAYLFFSDEWAAAAHRFVGGIALEEIIEAFAASIDNSIWVVLLLVFELETYILDDEKFTRRVTWTLHGLRAICYVIIVYAFFGYLAKLLFLLDATPLANVSELCGLVNNQWAYAVTLDEYAVLTAENCASMSDATTFHQFAGIAAVVDSRGLADITGLAWADVVNAIVWLLVVIVLEIDIRLQEANKLEGIVLRVSSTSKIILYTILLMTAIYWGVKSDFVDTWDAFLWLVAFVFIELNVFNWRQESLEQKTGRDVRSNQPKVTRSMTHSPGNSL